MPRFTSDASMVKSLFDSLVKKNTSFKVISEDQLALEWEGLDQIFLVEGSLAPTSMRLVAGFQAAGGTVVVDQNQLQEV